MCWLAPWLAEYRHYQAGTQAHLLATHGCIVLSVLPSFAGTRPGPVHAGPLPSASVASNAVVMHRRSKASDGYGYMRCAWCVCGAVPVPMQASRIPSPNGSSAPLRSPCVLMQTAASSMQHGGVCLVRERLRFTDPPYMRPLRVELSLLLRCPPGHQCVRARVPLRVWTCGGCGCGGVAARRRPNEFPLLLGRRRTLREDDNAPVVGLRDFEAGLGLGWPREEFG